MNPNKYFIQKFLSDREGHTLLNKKLELIYCYNTWAPSVEMLLFRFRELDCSIPSDANKISREAFEKFFRLTLATIADAGSKDNGEFYCVSDEISVRAERFGTTSDDRMEVYFNCSYDAVELRLQKRIKINRRKEAAFKETAAVITHEQFNNLLKATILYVIDPKSYAINAEKLLEKLRAIVHDNDNDYNFLPGTKDAHLQQLKGRKEHLEKQLIENDNYTPLERAALRGQIEGVEYALRVLTTG